jgi:hypothetical protein
LAQFEITLLKIRITFLWENIIKLTKPFHRSESRDLDWELLGVKKNVIPQETPGVIFTRRSFILGSDRLPSIVTSMASS